jgi:3-phenylpropionate/cinnamic acid dioxygenase small subunit
LEVHLKAEDSFTADRQQILDLISRYSYTWDTKDAEAWSALFLDDATVSTYLAGHLSDTMRSNKERLATARESHQRFIAQGIQTRHYQTNSLLERTSDGSVRGETMLAVVWQSAGDSAPKLVHSGTYRDVFVKTASGWKFASREIRLDHE